MKTTFMANPATVERKWYVVDAEGKTLGRLAAEVAKVLRGKNKPTFSSEAPQPGAAKPRRRASTLSIAGSRYG